MGKSGKKVKSDRINALRKQYDAFLEEDKRRKERNEYILGRLDKMRYCTAVVPLRQKPTLFNDRRDNFSTSSSLSQLNKCSLDISRQIDEAAMLQEISKKYILIPKIRPSTETENISLPTIKPNVDENGDWKSKYDILDQLKKREKESDASAFSAVLSQSNYDKQEREADALTLDTEHSQQRHNDAPQKEDDKNYDTKGYEDKIESPYKYDIPEKDKDEKPIKINLLEKKMEYEYYPFAELSENQTMNEDPQPNVNADISPQDYAKFNKSNERLEINAYQIEPESTATLQSEPPIVNQDANIQNYPMTEHDDQVDPAIYSEQNLPIGDDKDRVDTEKVYPEDINPVQVIGPDDLIKQINTTTLNATPYNVEQEQFPIEPVNVEDFTPADNVVLQDGVNINPEGYTIETVPATYDYNTNSEIAENIENTVDNSGIDAFETEQREMFYSEGVNENYDYTQGNIEEGYNQESAQGGDYNQAEAAVYYEGYEAEQAYSAEIGEHEETTQRYDPNYEQQYATDYAQQEYNQEGYEQQVYAQDPQYEGDINQVQGGLEHLQFEQHQEYENIENIEEQLDAEQGYKEMINMGNAEEPIKDLQKQPTEGLHNEEPQLESITS